MGKRKRWERALVLLLALNLVFSGIPASTVMEARAAAAGAKQETPVSLQEDVDSEKPEAEETAEKKEEAPAQQEKPEGESDSEKKEETGDHSEGDGTEDSQAPEETENPDGTQEPEEPQNPAEESPVEEPVEEEQPIEPLEDSELTREDLDALGEDEVGAAVWQTPANGQRMFRAVRRNQADWTFDTYYVNQDDSYYIRKTNDFNLKYQMEFHTSVSMPQYSVEIRIPAALVPYRDATKSPVPTSFAIPEGKPVEGGFVAARNSPFNYYIDKKDPETGEDTEERSKWSIVFFNYRDIPAGTNAAWQVLYKGLDIMEIKDGTTWSEPAKIKVTMPVKEEDPEEGEESREPLVEERETSPLKGDVDSKVELTGVWKSPYSSGKSYMPGLYTESQVASFAGGSLDEKYTGKNFAKYWYVVWQIDVRGNATQPWILSVKDTPKLADGTLGEIVGPEPWTKNEEYTYESSKSRNLNKCFYVVAAYPKPETVDGEEPEMPLLKNDVEVKITPYDHIGERDKVQKKQASAEWKYHDYQWNYGTDTIRVTKKNDAAYTGWLEAFKYMSQIEKKDYGDFFFSTEGWYRGYSRTHATSSSGGETLGTYRPGTSYKLVTTDDFMYAYPSNKGAAADQMLTDKDYYFTSVSVTQTDIGYDVWEDQTAGPETIKGVNQELSIYVMYEGESTWKLVKKIPWDASGKMSYTFTKQDLARKPWRVKAEHSTVNYSTTCTIDVSVRIRHDSPVFREIMKDYASGDLTSVRLENLSGVAGSYYGPGGYFIDYAHSQSINGGNYEEPGLIEATKKLWKSERDGTGILLQRDNAFKTLTGVEKTASASKSSRSTNDVANGRVLLDYYLTAQNGYAVYGQELINILKTGGLQAPDMKEVVFYDLLPYGVRFDPSCEVTAGRLTGGSSNSQTGSWDKSQVTVSVDSKKDIVENYKGSGRTLVAFHVKYAGADPSVYVSGKWMQGWGVSFRAYYDWKDLKVAQAGTNICAFMPEDGNLPLLGPESEVACDDGKTAGEDGDRKPLSGEYRYFSDGDINGDGKTDVRNVLYAQEKLLGEEFVRASESNIEKLVRADSNRFGVYGRSTVVLPGNGYTYDLTVSNQGKNPLTNIVVYDRLETAGKQDPVNENDPNAPITDAGNWTGTFVGVVTDGLVGLGITPEIYYSDRSDAPINGAADTLTAANHWYPAADFEQGHSLSEVKAVAVDFGTSFKLQNMQSASFQIKMEAPENTDNGEEWEGAVYNYPALYSYQEENHQVRTETGNSIRVQIGLDQILEVVKEFDGAVPNAKQNEAFEFYASQKEGTQEVPFANREYELWKLTDGKWVQQKAGERIYATRGDGCFDLHAGEKAVFKITDAERVQVKEAENPFWKSVESTAVTKNEEGRTVRTVTVKNTYTPLLFVQKFLQGVPSDVDVSEETFTFRIESDGQPLANAEYWYVDSVRTDGGVPSKVTTLGENGIGHTDEKGEFKIKKGEIIALFPGSEGTEYEVTEVLDSDGDWVCQKNTQEGKLSYNGSSVSITNYYRWKDLILTKEITHQDAEDYEKLNPQPKFTFRIEPVMEEGNGTLEQTSLEGKEWVLLDKDGKETDTKGRLEKVLVTDGGSIRLGAAQFTCACAGRMIRIKGLEQGKTYIITEIGTDAKYEEKELYRPANGAVEVTMPLYSGNATATITNDYQKRSLSVTKTVLYDQQRTSIANELKSKLFTMTVTVNEEPLSGFEYILKDANGEVVPAAEGESRVTDEKGSFTLKHGQTAVFKDAGMLGDSYQVVETQDDKYPQIYPTDKEEGYPGIFSGDGAELSFINGQKGTLVISKEYVGGDEKGRAYVQKMREYTSAGYKLRQDHRVIFTLEAEDENGLTYAWPDNEYGSVYAQPYDLIRNYGGPSIRWYRSYNYVAPWTTVTIPSNQLGGVKNFRLSEAEESQHKLFMWEGTWMEIAQKTPAQDGSFQIDLEESPIAVICNEITSVELGEHASRIEKRMALGSEPVPEGAVLTWRLEECQSGKWVPKEGVEYFLLDDKGDALSDRVLTTDEDGEIRLSKPAEGYPSVQFVTANVKLNQYGAAAEGTLRLVEVPEESDADWGVLIGYGKAGATEAEYSMELSSEEAVAFVNSNRTTPVEIAKTMATASDETFTMILKQVVSASVEGEGEKRKLHVESQARQGIPYTVYNEGEEKPAASGETGKNGEILLRPGQYARLDLPDKTQWTVSEEQTLSAPLKKGGMTGEERTPEKLQKLGENLMLINPEAEVIPARLQVTFNKGYYNKGDKIKKEDFTVSVIWSNGEIEEDIPAEEYTVTNPSATAKSGRQEVEIAWTRDSLMLRGQTEVTVFDGEVSLDKDIIGESSYGNLLDAETGEAIDLTKGDVIIPKSVRRVTYYGEYWYRIIGIAENAFQYKGNITSIEIPESVTSIGSRAFQSCSSLTSIKIPESVTSIGSGAFNDCSSLTSIEIPSSVTSIGSGAFYDCRSLASIEIPSSMTEIGNSTFSNCYSLTSIKIPESVTSIGSRAFQSCSSLTSIKIPESVTSIGGYAFQSCSSLTSIEIPGSVTEIGQQTFSLCNNLTSVEIREGVTSIGGYAFLNCERLKSIKIPSSVTSIGSCAFQSCKSLRSIEIPEGVKSIENQAFWMCYRLKSIEIPSSVTYMGSDIFSRCDDLESITIYQEKDAIKGAPWGGRSSAVKWVGTN